MTINFINKNKFLASFFIQLRKYHLKIKQSYNFKKYIFSFYLSLSNYFVFAVCDIETDPFCSGDIDAPIDEQLILPLLSCLIFVYSTIKKENIWQIIRAIY